MKKLQFILKIILSILTIFSLGTFSYNLFKLNLIPTKYLIIGYIILFIIIIGLFIVFIKFKNKIVYIISFVILLIINVLLLCATHYIVNTYKFLSKTQINEDKLNYSIIVLNTSDYSEITNLKDKNIAYLTTDYTENIKLELNKKISYEETLIDDLDSLLNALNENEVDAIVLEDSYLTILKEIDENFENTMKIIYTFTFNVDPKDEEENISVTSEPFILYVSGIDQYGSVTSVRGRSDVNQLIVVNPSTHKILLVNTPRDYYVQLAGTSGLKDKLTHAGIYGIDKSIKTLENFYNIDINYYLRVNFNTVIKLVDIIGGIDIYSDKSFVPHTDREVYVNKGWNNFNGKEALAYARERYAYIDGDHHRGRNQQQVMTAIIEKVTTSSVLIKNYNSILEVLANSFQTDMDMDLITSFIRFQLDAMPKWDIESIQVTGYNSKNYTYSMGTKYLLYVMEPNYDSVNNAKKRIEEVLNAS